MASFPKEHPSLYFDARVRTQKKRKCFSIYYGNILC